MFNHFICEQNDNDYETRGTILDFEFVELYDENKIKEGSDDMARTAREKSLFGTYLIKQFGGGCRQLFQNDDDRNTFINIVKKAKSKFGFRLYAYCLDDGDSYELIIYDNGSDISKIMKSINISYGMYAICEGKLFKDRYKSILIEDFPTLLKMTRDVNKSEDAQWSSYCVYSDISKDEFDIIDLDDLLHMVNDDIEIAKSSLLNYLDGDDETILCDSSKTFCEDNPKCLTCKDDALLKLNAIAEEKGLTTEALLKDKTQRNILIREFRRESTLSLKALGVLFGGLSESTVCKILNQ